MSVFYQTRRVDGGGGGGGGNARFPRPTVHLEKNKVIRLTKCELTSKNVIVFYRG